MFGCRICWIVCLLCRVQGEQFSTLLNSRSRLRAAVRFLVFSDVLFYDSKSLSAGVGVVHVREVPWCSLPQHQSTARSVPTHLSPPRPDDLENVLGWYLLALGSRHHRPCSPILLQEPGVDGHKDMAGVRSLHPFWPPHGARCSIPGL